MMWKLVGRVITVDIRRNNRSRKSIPLKTKARYWQNFSDSKSNIIYSIPLTMSVPGREVTIHGLKLFLDMGVGIGGDKWPAADLVKSYNFRNVPIKISRFFTFASTCNYCHNQAIFKKDHHISEVISSYLQLPFKFYDLAISFFSFVSL